MRAWISGALFREPVVTAAGALLVATVLVPLGMLVACLSRRARARMPALLGLAPLPGLGAALLAIDAPPLVLDPARLRLTLAIDSPGAMLLGVAALLWSAAGVYTWTYLEDDPSAGRFAEWWLLTLTGSLGVFVAGDLATFYIAFAIVSLAAWGLVAHDGTPRARRAGAIYLGLAVLGEIFLLLAFALLAVASPTDSLAIRDVVAAFPTSPWRNVTLAFLIAGFGLKAGLLPFHVWLPLAHPAAPMPASAVLSGAIIKAGVIGLVRFLPIEAGMPAWGEALTALGLLTAYYGVAIGITQDNPKTVLAYSSVSQMGVVAAVLGMGLAQRDTAAALAASFYAVHHLLAKGALFLAVGVVAATGARRLWPALLLVAVIALGLGGLPLSGGALAKLAVKAPLGKGLASTLATLSAAGTTLLMLHFLHRLSRHTSAEPDRTAPAGLAWPWLAAALASVAIPWALYSRVAGAPATDSLSPGDLWAALWPMAIGGILAVGLRRWGYRLPRVPEGDVVVVGADATRAARVWGDSLERAEGFLQQWPIAGVLLLALTVILGGALLLGR
ncbi:MAG TPA: complex I subunit 5 family protein [Candidatus Methylomirabilis sp.]|nr:complex I subunit 5 family protein [Candidatus Methylomirabilis sp.]